MKAINLTAALIAANDVTTTQADALVFDIIGKPRKYTMPEGVDYRRMAVEKAEYQRQAAKLTPKMKTIMDDFPKDHPNIIPDAITRTLKCLD